MTLDSKEVGMREVIDEGADQRDQKVRESWLYVKTLNCASPLQNALLTTLNP
jgi:hypothetical protein